MFSFKNLSMVFSVCVVTFALIVGSSFIGCFDDDDDDDKALDTACNMTGPPHMCFDYGSTHASQSQVDESCEGQGGEIMSECPTEGLLGTCSETLLGGDITISYYNDGDLTAVEAEYFCEAAQEDDGMGGTWTAAE